MTQSVGLWRTRLDRRPPALLLALIEALRADPSLDVSLVPAAVYWGRAPSKERSLIRLLLSEDWVIGSRVRRFFTVLFNGRNTTVQLGEPMSLRSLLEDDADTRTERPAHRPRAAQPVRAAAHGAHRTGPVAPAHHRRRGAAHARGARRRWRRSCARRASARAPRGAARGAALRE